MISAIAAQAHRIEKGIRMGLFKKFIAIALLALLYACGGGGGSAGSVPSGGSASTGGTSGTGTTVVTAKPTIVVSIHSPSGAEVTSISIGGGFTARAIVKDSAGVPVANKLVQFEITGLTLGRVNPDTALTDASGVASVSIAPASISSLGAATINASADVSGSVIRAARDFGVQASTLTLSSLVTGSENLPSGGNTSLQVTVQIGGLAFTGVPVNVAFTASCGRINNQDTTSGAVSVTTDGAGVAAATYTALKGNGDLCSGAVTLRAESTGAVAQSKVVSVAAPTANAIAYVNATPEQIFVAGTGAIDQSVVTFKVLSSAGTALPNQTVKFSIEINPGGVGLSVSGSKLEATATSNASGEVSIAVFSGTIPGPVKVRARLAADASVFSDTQNLTVASGPPSQRFMSLSAELFNPEAWNRDGTPVGLTVRIADRQGNAVADGTVVNFTAEGGQVARSCATQRVNGISLCSVTWIAQNPRPEAASLPGTVGRGRASVIAYLEGTKDYVDVNGNNRYDPGVDTLLNIGEAYRDDNENGSYDSVSGEFLIPRSGTQSCAGTGGPFPSRVNTCDANLATTVRQQIVLMLASSSPHVTVTSNTSGGLSFLMSSQDNRNLPMPAGTVLSAVAFDRTPGNALACTVEGGVGGSPLPSIAPGNDPAAVLATRHDVGLKDCGTGDSVRINIKSPAGLETSFTFTVP